ncbi:MAG: hypothetical protein ACRD2J_13800 [Thermoanaerobaculia bacterium]
MKRILALTVLLLVPAVVAAEGEKKSETKTETKAEATDVKTLSPAAKTPASPADAAASKDSPIVRAAKAAQKAREKRGEAKLSISDEDLKKDGGRLTISSGAGPDKPPEQSDMAILEAAAAERERERAAKAAADRQRREAILEEIERLEKDLGSLEHVAHDVDEIELSPRLAEIASHFEEKRKHLAELKKELAALGGESEAAPRP